MPVSTVFRSTHHPGNAPSGLVYTRALVGPIGVCTTPVMIGATAAALQSQPIWGYLVWGLPLAIILAMTWAQFSLSTTPAEIHLKPGQCAVQSVRDVLREKPPTFHPLYNVKVSPFQIELAIGWKTQECVRADWPQYGKLRKAAQQAHDSTSDPVKT